MHVDIKVAAMAGFFGLAGASIPLAWPLFFPPTPYVALPATRLEMGDSVRVDGGIYRLQVRTIEGQPHRFSVIIVGGAEGDQYRHNFSELAKASRVIFSDGGKEYALHVVNLESGPTGSAETATVEVDRLK